MSDHNIVKGAEFERHLRRLARRKNVTCEYVADKGKGSHWWFRLGRLRVLSGAEVCRILEQNGFVAVRHAAAIGCATQKWTNAKPQSEPRPGYPLGRARLPATHLANAPLRGALTVAALLEVRCTP